MGASQSYQKNRYEQIRLRASSDRFIALGNSASTDAERYFCWQMLWSYIMYQALGRIWKYSPIIVGGLYHLAQKIHSKVMESDYRNLVSILGFPEFSELLKKRPIKHLRDDYPHGLTAMIEQQVKSLKTRMETFEGVEPMDYEILEGARILLVRYTISIFNRRIPPLKLFARDTINERKRVRDESGGPESGVSEGSEQELLSFAQNNKTDWSQEELLSFAQSCKSESSDPPPTYEP